MSRIAKYSRAYVKRPDANRLIRIVEHLDPESIFIDMLRDYMVEVGFHDRYVNFGHIRISAVHPFAMLLFQEVMNQPFDFSVFPSITVSDSSDNSSYETISRNLSEVAWGSGEVAQIKGHVADGTLFTSDQNVTKLEAATANNGTVIATNYIDRAVHTIDFNIWTDNKIVTSAIFDVVRHFVVQNAEILHQKGFDFIGDIMGRRSGDINIDFGKILYGANISVKLTIPTESSMIDLSRKAMRTFEIHDTYTNFNP